MAQQTHFEQIDGQEATARERARTTPTLDDDTLDNDNTAPLPIITEEGVAATPEHDDSPDEWRIGDIVDGRFVVQQRLGRGRYGPVFKALDRALSDPQIEVEHHVVLEALPPWIAERATFIERLEQLRSNPQAWSHPSIAKVLGFGRDGDKYFFCEELLEGASLRVVLENAPDALEEHEVLGVLRYVGDALNYAHSKGIVHGDLRLTNVFVTEAYEVKLTGFLPSTEPRLEPVFVEDPSSGGQLHPSDDVYGLACLAYELLTRRHPYGGNTPLEALRAGLTAHPALNLSPPRWQALSRGLALRRELRTASIPELLAGLGVTGDETLRPAPKNIEITPPREAKRAEATPWPEITSPVPASSSPRLIASPTVAPPRPEHFAAGSAADDFAAIYSEPAARHMRPRRRRRRSSPARAIVSVVLAAGLATFAYFNHAWLRDRAAGFMETAAALVSQRSAAPAAGPPPAAPTATAPPGAAPTPAAPTPAAPPAAAPPAAAPPAAPTVAATGAEPTIAAPAMTEPSAVTPAIEPPPAVSTSGSELEPARATSAPTPSDRPAPAITAPQPAVAAAVTESPTFGFAERTLTVNEGDSSVRVLIRRTGSLDEPASVVWWTADGTAVADEDYAVLGARVARFAAGADTEVLLVPLIADSVPEPRESFFIHLAAERAGGPAKQLEVVVLDDDR